MRITFGREFARLIPFLGLLLISASSTAFAQFDSATVLGTVRDSNGGALPGATVTLKNVATGITVYQFDLGLQKDFRLPINDAWRLEFRAETFNLFNKTNFDTPNSDRSNAAFGTIRSAFPARQIQFALKLSF